MQQRTHVFMPPQAHDNFLSIYMTGSLSIVELDRWETQLWFDYGIVFFGSNDNFVASNDDQMSCGPEDQHTLTDDLFHQITHM